MSTGIQGPPVWKDRSAFNKQYETAKEISDKNALNPYGDTQGDPAISLGNGLAIKIAAGNPEQRRRGGPKMKTAILSINIPAKVRNTQDVSHQGDYLTFASFIYKDRKDLIKQLNQFMQGWRSNDKEPERDDKRTTLENYHNEIRMLKGQLTMTPDEGAKKKMEADIKTLESKAQGVYQNLQTFVNSMPDDKGKNTGNSTDKAKVQALLNEFDEFKPSIDASSPPSIDASPKPAVKSSSKHPVKNFFQNLFKHSSKRA